MVCHVAIYSFWANDPRRKKCLLVSTQGSFEIAIPLWQHMHLNGIYWEESWSKTRSIAVETWNPSCSKCISTQSSSSQEVADVEVPWHIDEGSSSFRHLMWSNLPEEVSTNSPDSITPLRRFENFNFPLISIFVPPKVILSWPVKASMRTSISRWEVMASNLQRLEWRRRGGAAGAWRIMELIYLTVKMVYWTLCAR